MHNVRRARALSCGLNGELGIFRRLYYFLPAGLLCFGFLFFLSFFWLLLPLPMTVSFL
jgi:hypothetical protein